MFVPCLSVYVTYSYFNPVSAKLYNVNFNPLTLCLATATHNYQSVKITRICLICDQFYSCKSWCLFEPLGPKSFNWNFHSLEVVSRWRNPQLQVSENYTDLTKWSYQFQILLIYVTFYLWHVKKVVLIMRIKKLKKIEHNRDTGS